MEFLSDTVILSRMQFALTAIFHMLFPVLTTGMAIYLIVVEGLWLKTRNKNYYFHARFWAKLYVLNFGIGVASGLPMEFEFGTNWTPFSQAVGDFFGSVLGFEASMAFALEAGFLGIMLFGWERVPPVIHYFATIMVAIGANLSIFWILSANSWLQTPAGGEFVNGHFVVSDYFQAIFNPFMLNSVLHREQREKVGRRSPLAMAKQIATLQEAAKAFKERIIKGKPEPKLQLMLIKHYNKLKKYA